MPSRAAVLTSSASRNCGLPTNMPRGSDGCVCAAALAALSFALGKGMSRDDIALDEDLERSGMAQKRVRTRRESVCPRLEDDDEVAGLRFGELHVVCEQVER